MRRTSRTLGRCSGRTCWGDASDEEVDDFEATELTESEADTIHVMDEDTGRTTLGAIFRDAPERGYACGTEL